jgi:GNAT superfamily N-acetyltransferase
MAAQSGNTFIVAEVDGRLVGYLQLTFIQGLSYKGASRAQIEDVRVARDLRGQGIGARLMEFAEERARAAGCGLVCLSSNKARADAHRFYERLGYVASHLGFKKALK